jgi:hypothetical protein
MTFNPLTCTCMVCVQKFEDSLDDLEIYSNKVMDKIRNIDREKEDIDQQIRQKNQSEQLEEKKLHTLRTDESVLKVENFEFKNKLNVRVDIAKLLGRKYALDISLVEEWIDDSFTSSRFSEKVSLFIDVFEPVTKLEWLVSFSEIFLCCSLH